jgi:hypothetical protein
VTVQRGLQPVLAHPEKRSPNRAGANYPLQADMPRSVNGQATPAAFAYQLAFLVALAGSWGAEAKK